MRRWTPTRAVGVIVWAAVPLLVGDAADAQAGNDGSGTSIRPPRLVRLFDFEETDDRGVKLGHGVEMPRDWYAIGRDPMTSDPLFLRQPLHRRLTAEPGFPDYAPVGFDPRHVRSGDFSLRLGLEGGHSGAFLAVGALVAKPGSDYLITAQVRTAELRRSAAVMRAYFVDASGQPIDASAVESRPLRTQGQWHTVSVRLMGEHAQAAYIGLELRLLQPDALATAAPGPMDLVFQDVRGDAWFDDVAVWQLPHLAVTTQSEVNIIRAPDRPRLTMNLRDLTGQRLTAEVIAYDHGRRVVDRQRQGVGAGAPNQWTWEPRLPAYGWYLIELRVSEPSDSDPAGGDVPLVARTLTSLLWLAPLDATPGPDGRRFSLSATGLPDDQLELLPTLLYASGLRSAVVSLWTPRTTASTLSERQAMLDRLLRATAPAGRELTFALSPLPRELAQAYDVARFSAIDMLELEPEEWLGYLRPMLLRYGQRIRRWQLGAIDDADLFHRDDRVERFEAAKQVFERLAAGPRFVLPWRLDQPLIPELASEQPLYAVLWPLGVRPEHLAGALDSWAGHRDAVNLHVQTYPADQVDHPRRVADLALRMLHAWEQEPAGMTLERPWAFGRQRDAAALPDPLLGVFSEVAQRLTNRRVLERLPLGEGLEAMILDGSAGPMLAAWNREAPDDASTVRLHLGESPVGIDVWGNREPIPDHAGVHELRLTRTPRFVEGIDVKLALLRASFRLDDAFIPSTQETHRRTLEMTNPWPTTISGDMRIAGPEGWTVKPTTQPFTLAPGRTMRIPLEVSPPLAEVAGTKRLTARCEFTANRPYAVDLTTPVRVGLRGVEFDASVTLSGGEADDRDAIVVAIITNTGEASRSLYVFATLWGHPRQEQVVTRLEPGESVLRQFRFRGGAASLRENPIRTGIRDTDGPTVLNKLLTWDRSR